VWSVRIVFLPILDRSRFDAHAFGQRRYDTVGKWSTFPHLDLDDGHRAAGHGSGMNMDEYLP
jgi:hypothetical protein